MGIAGHKIVRIRAFISEGGGADYHDQGQEHWIVGQIATPMSIYPKYKASRLSFGINTLKTLVVEVEADNGVAGFGITTGGYPAAWIIMNHLERFLIGEKVENIERIWDEMYRSTLFYGRKGVVMNAISAVDLALWDLLGKLREEPVYAMLGGKVRDELEFYATGPRPDLAKGMGFIGGKLPLIYGPADGQAGLIKNLELAQEMKNKVDDSRFMLMYDCWMALTLPYAIDLMRGLSDIGFRWMEECFNPDDYWSYRDLKKAAGNQIWITAGEHEATRYGFRMLVDDCNIDLIQPDVGWCGGMTELIKIADLAESYGKMVIPHGSSIYSHHFMVTRVNSPFSEYIMMSPNADHIVGQFSPLILNEPMPDNGIVNLTEKPGFGVELNKKGSNLKEVTKGQEF